MRILVLDDEPAITESWARIFNAVGYEVAAFEQGQEALESARSLPPDLAIIDVRLQDQDGLSLAKELISIAPSCKVLLMTGCTDAVAQLDSAGAQDFDFELLLKPISPPELLDKIRTKLAMIRV